jgi:hypothetical protein
VTLHRSNQCVFSCRWWAKNFAITFERKEIQQLKLKKRLYLKMHLHKRRVSMKPLTTKTVDTLPLGAYLQNFFKMIFFDTFLENWYLRDILKKNYLEYFLRKSKKIKSLFNNYNNFFMKIFKKILRICTLAP